MYYDTDVKLPPPNAELTFQICASHKLQHLVDEDDGEGELQHHDPLFCV